MEKEEIIKYFIAKGILSKDGTKRKNCWKAYYDNEANEIFIKFSLNYRTSDEAWFCLLHNIEPYYCEVCGQLAKFTGRVKSKIPGYLTVCENCSANNSPIKQNNYNFTISKRTKEDRKKIINKRKKTNLEKYGDENYTLYGSSKFRNVLKTKYGSETYNNREKAKQTCLEKYGVSSTLSLMSSDEKK